MNPFASTKTQNGDNIFISHMRERFDSVVSIMEKVSGELDDYYGLYLLPQDVQLVIGGLKAMTTIHVDKNLLQTYMGLGLAQDFNSLEFARALFEHAGLKLDEFGFSQSENITTFYLYNPTHVRWVQENFFPGEDYHGQNLNTWLKHVSEKGISLARLKGYLLGFPSFAVAQYETYHSATHCRIQGRKVVAGYGESYMIWGESSPRDVELREELKEQYFSALFQDVRYRNLMEILDEKASAYRIVSLNNIERMIAQQVK